MKLTIRRSTVVNTDIKLDLDKDWKKLKKDIEENQQHGILEGADTSSKDAFISNLNSGTISKFEFFNFLQNYACCGELLADDYGDENYEVWTI
jgi:hypothetical protein